MKGLDLLAFKNVRHVSCEDVGCSSLEGILISMESITGLLLRLLN